MHSRTTSPSSLMSRRRTPWVEGCCGPMLTHISSMASVMAGRMKGPSSPRGRGGGTPLSAWAGRRTGAGPVAVRLDQIEEIPLEVSRRVGADPLHHHLGRGIAFQNLEIVVTQRLVAVNVLRT